MARTVAKIKVTIWRSEEYRSLPMAAQWLYKVLLTQGTLNLAGCVAYAPERWAGLCPDATVQTVEHALEVLERARFVAVDRSTGEVVVRTFTTHDLAEGTLNANLVKGFWSAWDTILSATLRHYVVVNVAERVWSWEKVDHPSEAEKLRSEPWSEPWFPEGEAWPEPDEQTSRSARLEPWSGPSVSFSVSDSTTVAAPVTVDEKLTAAARIMAAAECDRRISQGDTIGNPPGYIESRVPPLRRQNEDAWRSLLEADPTTTAEQLAAPPTPANRRPDWVQAEESTSAAAEARYLLAERVRLGQACPSCNDTGRRYDDELDTVVRCEHDPQEVHP